MFKFEKDKLIRFTVIALSLFVLFFLITFLFDLLPTMGSKSLYPVPKKREMSQYEGGSNPILVYIILFLLFAALLVFAIRKIVITFRQRNYESRCATSKLSTEEQLRLDHFIQKFSVTNPFLLISNRLVFDRFSNQVAQGYSATDLSAKALALEVTLFDSIRKKLHLKHTSKEKNLKSSRSLITRVPLHVTFSDRDTDSLFSYIARILEINDLYIAITPPEDKTFSTALLRYPHAPLTISFVRPHDSEYEFDTTIFRTIHSPSPMLYIHHSRNLKHCMPQKLLDLPLEVMFTSQGKSETSPAVLDLVDIRGATFHLDNPEISFPIGTSLFLDFTLEEGSIFAQGKVVELVEEQGHQGYHVEFHDLTESNSQALLKYMMTLKAENRRQKS